MSEAPFVFCPRCATLLVPREAGGRTRPTCPKDGFVYWGNPTPVVGALVEIDGKLLLARGKGWPEKMFGIITGFLEAGETPEAGVVREVKEELGLDVELVSLIGVYAFEMRNELIACWHAMAPAGATPQLSDELEAFKLVPPEKLRAWEFGTGLAVRDWLKRRQP